MVYFYEEWSDREVWINPRNIDYVEAQDHGQVMIRMTGTDVYVKESINAVVDKLKMAGVEIEREKGDGDSV